MRAWLATTLIALAAAQFSSLQTSVQTGDGVVRVTVRRAGSGEGVPDAIVTLNGTNISEGQAPEPLRTVTDSSGTAVFRNLVIGRYSAHAEAEGYLRMNWEHRTYTAPAADIDSSHKQQDIEIRLAKTSVIAGRIRDAQGNPVAKAQVSAMIRSYRDGRPILANQANTTTNDLGEYRMFSLGPNDYYITAAVRPAYGPVPLRQEAALALLTYYPGVTGISGATPVTVGIGEEREAVDFEIPRIPVYAISGTLLLPASSSPRVERLSGPGGSFYLVPHKASGSDGIGDEFLQVPDVAPRSSVLSTEIPFELRGIPPGSYDVIPVCCQITGQSGRASVAVTSADVRNVRIPVRPNVDIQGRVRVQGDLSSFPWDSVRVALRPLGPMPQSGSLTSSMKPFMEGTDPSMREFTIKGVPEGRFAVVVESLHHDAYISAIQAGPTDLFRANGFDVDGSFNGVIDVVVVAKGGSIRGTVQRGILERGVSVSVSLVPETSKRGIPNLYKRVETSTAGEFHIHGIAPGNYKLFAWATRPPDTAEQNAGFLKPFENLGYLITVTGETPEGIALPLIGK
jgi:hypothetical protein